MSEAEAADYKNLWKLSAKLQSMQKLFNRGLYG